MTESKAWGCPTCGGTGTKCFDPGVCPPEHGYGKGGCENCPHRKPCPTCLAHFQAVSDAVQGERERCGNLAPIMPSEPMSKERFDGINEGIDLLQRSILCPWCAEGLPLLNGNEESKGKPFHPVNVDTGVGVTGFVQPCLASRHPQEGGSQ